MFSEWSDDFRKWLARPFSADMPASHWFLLIGLILVCIVLWNVILSNIVGVIKGAAE